MHRFLVLSLLIWVLACGDDDGPGPTFANVNGSWTLSITNMGGGGSRVQHKQPG
jgi:hypothetical protein